MSKSIAIFGAGPGLGQAVARRFAKDGYTVVLVARHSEPLNELVRRLSDEGFQANAITADLADVDAIPSLADRIRQRIGGDIDVFYYGAAANGMVPLTELTIERVRDLMPLGVYALVALVRQFLPAMVKHGSGAILSAQGASALRGNPNIAGGMILAAQRNYLQALYAEVAERGVYVGGLYIGAAIENSAFHRWLQKAKAEGGPVPAMPTVSPDHLADLLWNMQRERKSPDASYPKEILHARTAS